MKYLKNAMVSGGNSMTVLKPPSIRPSRFPRRFLSLLAPWLTLHTNPWATQIGMTTHVSMSSPILMPTISRIPSPCATQIGISLHAATQTPRTIMFDKLLNVILDIWVKSFITGTCTWSISPMIVEIKLESKGAKADIHWIQSLLTLCP